MLKNIPKILPPELLKIMSEMGHGDELVIADGNFPSENLGQRVIRMDGHGGKETLDAVMKLFPLDTYAESNSILMEVVKGDKVETPIWKDYENILNNYEKGNVKIGHIERFAFYDRAKTAYAVIATGEEAIYANLILKKGVIK